MTFIRNLLSHFKPVRPEAISKGYSSYPAEPGRKRRKHVD